MGGAPSSTGTTECGRCAFDVRPSPLDGRGVFAADRRSAGDELWSDPVLLLPRHELDGIVTWYTIEWDDEHEALALGRTSLLNHSGSPNSELQFDPDELLVHVVATRPIAAGDEILIDYGPGHAAELG